MSKSKWVKLKRGFSPWANENYVDIITACTVFVIAFVLALAWCILHFAKLGNLWAWWLIALILLAVLILAVIAFINDICELGDTLGGDE